MSTAPKDTDSEDPAEPDPEKDGRPRDDTPVLPRTTRDDTDLGWGERPVDADQWLRDQRPPHWD